MEINGKPKIKLSQDVEKVTMPGKKNAFRLYSNDGKALIDLLQKPEEEAPEVGKRVLCRHPFQVKSFELFATIDFLFPVAWPFQESKRAWVTPSKVEPLYSEYWSDNKVAIPYPSMEEIRETVQMSMKSLRQDHKRSLNPTPYKVRLRKKLKKF